MKKKWDCLLHENFHKSSVVYLVTVWGSVTVICDTLQASFWINQIMHGLARTIKLAIVKLVYYDVVIFDYKLFALVHFNIRSGWWDFIVTMFYSNSCPNCKQYRPWSDAMFCGIWSGSTVCQCPFYGTQGINGLKGMNTLSREAILSKLFCPTSEKNLL